MHAFESALEIKNVSAASVQFILEPWGNEYVLRPGSTIRCEFQSATAMTIPVSHQDNVIMVEGSHELHSTGIWLDGQLVG
ncbi:hypothetical protein SAMN05421753_105185 [Planctomicrobium piriforme]|uniref:Uncharacterized protein n=1 Tax=Planctomicrobium piriforme TaxID=1576369 RepID=A0A1I3FD65_9PLAN|nr:hypothetical protein SAMN05421753_105185 [Planctomicrobium piriforme]